MYNSSVVCSGMKWFSRFSAEGYETVCIIEGLGQLAAVRDIYAEHAYRAIASLDS